MGLTDARTHLAGRPLNLWSGSDHGTRESPASARAWPVTTGGTGGAQPTQGTAPTQPCSSQFTTVNEAGDQDTLWLWQIPTATIYRQATATAKNLNCCWYICRWSCDDPSDHFLLLVYHDARRTNEQPRPADRSKCTHFLGFAAARVHDPGRGGQKRVSLTAPWAPVPTLLTSTVSQEIPDPTVPAINSNDEKSSCVPHQEISDAAAGSWKIMSCAYARRLKIKSRQTWARRALMTWKPQYVTLWMRLQTQKWAGPHAMGYGFSCCTKLQKPISAIALGNWEASLVNPGSNNYFNRLRRQNNVQLPPMTVARPAIMSNNVWLHLVKWRGGESSLAESYCPKHREKTLHTRMDYQHW